MSREVDNVFSLESGEQFPLGDRGEPLFKEESKVEPTHPTRYFYEVAVHEASQGVKFGLGTEGGGFLPSAGPKIIMRRLQFDLDERETYIDIHVTIQKEPYHEMTFTHRACKGDITHAFETVPQNKRGEFLAGYLLRDIKDAVHGKVPRMDGHPDQDTIEKFIEQMAAESRRREAELARRKGQGHGAFEKAMEATTKEIHTRMQQELARMFAAKPLLPDIKELDVKSDKEGRYVEFQFESETL